MTTILQVKDLKRIVAAIDNFSKTSMVSSEANTKKKIIEPLLAVLGWDPLSNEVLLEHAIKIGSTTKHVDYALMLENKPVVLVEAKAFDATLSHDDSAQIISYGKIEEVQWVVLTNGGNLKVLDTKAGKTEKECLIFGIDLKKLPKCADELSLISRESVLTGDIEAATKRLAATKSAIQNLKHKKQKIAEEFDKILVEITGAEVKNHIKNLSVQLAEQTIQLFEKQVAALPGPEPKKEIQLMTRKQLAVKPSGEVVLCISRIEGVAFLEKYNAWGFISMKRKVPYFALYVGKPRSSVLYFGEIESITQPLKSKEDLGKIQKDVKTFEAGKRVIHLKPGTLVKFEDPIPLKNKKSAPRGLRYTTLKKLIQANNIAEL